MLALLTLIQLLTPISVLGPPKIRVGKNNDGGYIMLPPSHIEATISYGIADDFSFELQIANLTQKPVYMYDHTIRPPVLPNPLLIFTKEGIGAKDEGPFRSLVTHVGTKRGQRLLLKIDVEGAEYASLRALPPLFLETFDQIVMELHHIDTRLDEAVALLSLLNQTHHLYHLHGNNHAHPFSGIPSVIELSWIRRGLYPVTTNQAVYPTALDQPCNPRLADLPLSFSLRS